jgi:methylated-DNA-[protein]-cysteine S-methyltransferase
MTDTQGAYIEPLGIYLRLERSGDKIKRVFFSLEGPEMISELAQQIADHLLKDGPFYAELDLENLTDFQREVYSTIMSIPRGKTTTYGEVAKLIGRPNASRAVGRALGANPIAILIPCHRVLSKKGLGGYYWGIDLKKKLLDLEKSNL